MNECIANGGAWWLNENQAHADQILMEVTMTGLDVVMFGAIAVVTILIGLAIAKPIVRRKQQHLPY